jgi:hypothetical protein
MKTKKFKKITGGTEEYVYKKFSWLKEAEFENAEIDITNDFLVWKDGIWKDGTWEFGIWENGIWENGLWKYGTWEFGIWKDGTWVNGQMWSNLKQKFVKVEWDGKEFREADKR